MSSPYKEAMSMDSLNHASQQVMCACMLQHFSEYQSLSLACLTRVCSHESMSCLELVVLGIKTDHHVIKCLSRVDSLFSSLGWPSSIDTLPLRLYVVQFSTLQEVLLCEKWQECLEASLALSYASSLLFSWVSSSLFCIFRKASLDVRGPSLVISWAGLYLNF